MQITRGTLDRPVRCVIYGPEGIGKSTIAAQAPNPLFIDLEGGTAKIDCARVEAEKINFATIIMYIEEAGKTDFQTIVIDTLDRAEDLCIKAACPQGIEAPGFGKGYTLTAEKFQELLKACDKLIEAGKNVILLAHAAMRKQELPDAEGSFDRWELKLTKKCSPLAKEWCDALLFANYKTFVTETKEKTHKAVGGARTFYTEHRPAWDAKNRFGLADEIPMEYKHIAKIFTANAAPAKSVPVDPKPEKPADPHEELKNRLDERGISKISLLAAIASRGKYVEATDLDDYPDSFIETYIFKYWDKVLEIINSTIGGN